MHGAKGFKSGQPDKYEKTSASVGRERKTYGNKRSAPPKKSGRKPTWMTKSMAEDYSREDILRATVIEFLSYFVFVICVCCFVMGSQSSYNYYLTKSVSTQFVEKEFDTESGFSIRFTGINSAADLWMYLEKHFVPSLFWEYTYDKESMKDENAMNIMYDNRVLGVPRIRQVKVRNDTCVVHTYFRDRFKGCYGRYNSLNADKDDFGPGGATAWIYSSEEETKSMSHTGQVATYTGDGFYTDLFRDRNRTIELIQYLKENEWIRRGTRAVIIDMTVYNTNTDLYAGML
ncbi:unnamed protein product [Acanthoscelides obtectus]|uniref:Polycystin domain-containing protein n=1 Tax=Acanthoscelides obtectus TaxID=200917 RepID=A0A9P0KE84_ACAOB|nr:unnamed protein product [Acanthoscelides obtectus]CAK1660886.1 Polycystin-2 [Acanthoscelides obtectus]